MKFTFTDEEISKQNTIDQDLINAAWQSLERAAEEKMGSDYANELVLALKEMYALFDDLTVDWLASLYDKSSGGFYYSESGRDNDGYGPDVESTYQAIQYLYCTEMVDNISSNRDDGELHDIFPKELCDKMVRWIKGLQDKDSGYLYHPQWGRELTDKLVARRGRDLQFGMILLKRLSASPTYNTPTGETGDGVLPNGERVEIPLCIRSEKARDERTVAEHLINKENFEKYLKSLPIDTSPYSVGNLLESQAGQFVLRDKELMASGADYSLCQILKEFFDAHQNPKTGLWTHCDDVTYEGTNGMMKIGSTYHKMGKEIPNPIAALHSAKKGIDLEDPDTVCYVLNPWYAISIISSNVEKFAENNDKKIAEAFRADLLLEYPELLRTTTQNMKLFKKANGPFSFRQKATMANNQGAPSAVPGTNEGDTNATNCMRGCLDHVRNILSSVLGVECPRVYGTAAYMRFMNLINEKVRENEK